MWEKMINSQKCICQRPDFYQEWVFLYPSSAAAVAHPCVCVYLCLCVCVTSGGLKLADLEVTIVN